MLERADQLVFQAWAGLDPDPLIQAGDHFFDVRVPLRTMGIADARRTKITIGDAQWPKSVVFSAEARSPYPLGIGRMPITIESGPTRCSTRVSRKPASFIQP